MVTKQELERLVEQVNQVLANYDERLKKLENKPTSNNRAKKQQNS